MWPCVCVCVCRPMETFSFLFFFPHSQLKCLEKACVHISLPLKLREIIAARYADRLARVFSVTICSLALPHFINGGGRW